MPNRKKLSAAWAAPLISEVQACLPLFYDLPLDTIEHLAASGFGRGFLTASLRAKLRRAGIGDLGHLAQSSSSAIAGIRKFGPVRVGHIRALLLEEIARWLPGAREIHASEATTVHRIARLRSVPVEHLILANASLSALGVAGAS